MASRSYSDKTVKLLFSRCGYFCPFPGCMNRIVEDGGGRHDPNIRGQIAHIESFSDDGPRANLALTVAERNDYPNLLVLCAHHHGLADAEASTYTVDEMREWKNAAGRNAEQRLTSGIVGLTFAELKLVCQGITEQPGNLESTPMTAPPVLLPLLSRRRDEHSDPRHRSG